MYRLFLFIAIFSLTSSTSFAQLTDMNLPSVSLTDLNGKGINTGELSKDGKITLISFWATWCPPCKKELNNINDVYEDWQKKYNMKLIAISIDDVKSTYKIKPYADDHKWEFQVLLDQNQNLKRALNIQNVPHTILLDKSGKIAYSHSGYVDGDELILEEEMLKLSKK
jgi:cytochrome c biogenesis protein CcmG/thiol:disulfide interchange protein DsbE